MPKRSRSKDSTHRRSLDTPQHSLSPLPTALQHLLDQFTRLNTLCTFWNAHLSSAITFTTLKASISDLEITHLAAIKTVSPHSLELMYLSDSPPVLRVQWGVSNGKQAVTHNKANVKPDTLRKTICTQNELFRKALERFAAVCQEKVKKCPTPEDKHSHFLLFCFLFFVFLFFFWLCMYVYVFVFVFLFVFVFIGLGWVLLLVIGGRCGRIFRTAVSGLSPSASLHRPIGCDRNPPGKDNDRGADWGFEYTIVWL
ncbi:hypothetical protein BDF14DRAFT_1785385 [Spinellus fusiger]|nr:hypothetical protein BDF14DRAFT_1785385 [Spinellus fusiger]